jgi:hypothetical protein
VPDDAVDLGGVYGVSKVDSPIHAGLHASLPTDPAGDVLEVRPIFDTYARRVR